MLTLESGFFITAELRVKNEDKIQQTKSALEKLCQQTINEPGCSLFCLHQCKNDERRFLLWERFDDEEAFKQHFLEPHTEEYVSLDLTDIVQYFQTDVLCA